VGEIDVIMENAGVIHFIEVKSVSRERFRGVIHETREGRHLPEENVGRSKLRKMAKVIQMYLGEKRMMDKKWQFDVAVVYLELRKQKAHIRFIKDVLVAG
jgi:Holliday junction resolvase-like predicted endonuclease